MNLSSQTANRFKEIILNGDWVTGTNYKKELSTVSLATANKQIGTFNTIAKLTFHIHYYIKGVLQVLEGGTLNITDKYSFDMAPVNTEKDWEELKQSLYNDAQRFSDLVGQMPEEKLMGNFVESKYGTYLRNIDALIEHSYYHLGQIVILKKLTA